MLITQHFALVSYPMLCSPQPKQVKVISEIGERLVLNQAHDHERDEALLSWVATQLSLRCGLSDFAKRDDHTLTLSSGLIEHSLTHELGGLIWELTSKGERDRLPSANHLRDAWLQQNSAHLARSVVLTRHWPSDVPSPLLFKGGDLELYVYAHFGLSPGCRASSDWDLMLPEPSYATILELWTQEFGPPHLPRSSRLPCESPHEVGFEIDGLLIEVHRDPAPRFFSPLRGHELWERARTHRLAEGLMIRLPRALDRLYVWLINYAKAGGLTRALSWVDLTLILMLLHHHHHGLFVRQSEVDQSMRRGLNRYGLNIAIREALTQWVTSPFARVNPQVSARIEAWLSDTLCRPELHFRHRITSTSPRWRLGIAQVRLCAPHLRWGYLWRALRALGSSPRATR